MCGCLPSSSSESDEQKDPHYINGRNLVSGLDYKGAVNEFEKALEVNPRSAAAHFELALIYGEQMKDHAAAIYHLQQHLKLRPTSEYADRINGLIRTYKTELVKSDFIAPMNLGMQRDLERLTTENTMLKRQVETLQSQLGTRQVLATNTAQPSARYANPVLENRVPSTGQPTSPRLSSPRETVTPLPRAKSYTVKSGDTVTSIAKECRVKISTLLQANPGVDPRRLKVGQPLNVPAS
ncbi:MAG: LysM peptidoglycan-binding protein [Verrucomicrobiales bacterium]|nr:LysM peptidoglycan-binding protein [Verrucomicrobiales bacterium]